MRLLLLNIFLAMGWVLMWGAFNAYTFVVGLVFGAVLLAALSRSLDHPTYGTKLFQLIDFSFYFVRIVVIANLQVAREVMRKEFTIKPRIVRYDVSGLTLAQVTALSSTFTLTPGTLSLDLSPDGRWLYVHCLFGADREAVIRDLDQLRDRMTQEIFS